MFLIDYDWFQLLPYMDMSICRFILVSDWFFGMTQYVRILGYIKDLGSRIFDHIAFVTERTFLTGNFFYIFCTIFFAYSKFKCKFIKCTVYWPLLFLTMLPFRTCPDIQLRLHENFWRKWTKNTGSCVPSRFRCLFARENVQPQLSHRNCPPVSLL